MSGRRYAKAFDPDNWFTIDEDTAAIKLNKRPDRESPLVVNGSYVAKIVAIAKGTTANNLLAFTSRQCLIYVLYFGETPPLTEGLQPVCMSVCICEEVITSSPL